MENVNAIELTDLFDASMPPGSPPDDSDGCTVEFRDTSSLQFGGIFISSDFYLGRHRLRLALKSTSIDRSTDHRRSGQKIAVIAPPVSSEMWPCEGTAVMRFKRQAETQTPPIWYCQPNLSSSADNEMPSFSVDFSIREPVSVCEEAYGWSLPIDVHVRWTAIPQDCIPFYLRYDHDLMNNDPIVMEIQEVKRSISESTSKAINQTIMSCASQLRTAVSGDLARLSGRMVANGLISQGSCSELKNEDVTEADRAARLVKLVQTKVKLDPRNFFKFIDILKEDSLSNYNILTFLTVTYNSQVSAMPLTSCYKDHKKAHILTRKELNVLATLLGDEKLIEFILEKQGGDVSLEELQRSLAMNGFMSVASHVEGDLKRGMENMEHYEAYQQALRHGSCLTLSYLKFLFFGPPRSGKTSTRRRMLREIINLSQLGVPSVSTGVAEINDVIIKKLTSEPAAITSSQWWPIMRAKIGTNLDMHNEGDLRYLAQIFYRLIYKSTTSFLTSSSESAPAQPHCDHIETSVDTQTVTHRIEFQSVSRLTNSEETEIKNIFEKLNSILQFDCPEELEQLLEELIMINMTDVGGQPAFLDMLPALTTGPALYLLFFRLSQDLKAYYPVRYLPADSNSEITLESSYSIEEILFQSLASIACFSCHSLQPSSFQPQAPCSTPEPQAPGSAESTSKPQAPGSTGSTSQPQSRALLFGTYKDQVEEDQISQIESTLQEKFIQTKLYKKGILLKSSNGKMMLTVDNMFGTDQSEMSDIRKDIQEIIKVNFPPVPIPASWLIFRIVLHLLKKPVVSLAQCEEIARQLHMLTPVKEALWFFHHNIGSLMHYPDIPSMKDMVICNPQVIFDCISTLIIDQFKFENRALESYEVDEFYQKGQFTLSHIKDKTGQQTCPLTLNQLMDLLKYHNVLAEIKQDQEEIGSSQFEEKFIMPAVLKSASDEELSTLTAASSEGQVIMIHFEGGFVPFGVFSTCTAHLIAHQDSISPKWQLCEDIVRRNRITFRVDGAVYVTIIARPQYLQIIVSCHPRARCKRSIPEIYSIVRQTVTETLKTVISKMKYKPFGTLLSSCTEQPFDLAFKCCLEASHGDHLMKVIEDETGRYAKCLKDSIDTHLEEKHCIWFTQEINSMTESQFDSSAQPNTDVSGSSSTALLTVVDLNTVRSSIWDARSKWYDVGLELGIPAATLDAIRVNKQSCEDCYTEMLKRWLEGSNQTWSTLADALRSPSVGMGALAGQLCTSQ